jgi:hypothetical protein
MEASLTGRLILIAEDEPLIAFEIMQGLRMRERGSSWPTLSPKAYG